MRCRHIEALLSPTPFWSKLRFVLDAFPPQLGKYNGSQTLVSGPSLSGNEAENTLVKFIGCAHPGARESTAPMIRRVRYPPKSTVFAGLVAVHGCRCDIRRQTGGW